MANLLKIRPGITLYHLFLLLFLPVLLSGQDTLVHTRFSQNFRIVYNHSAALSENGNAILREIGKEILKDPGRVRITMTVGFEVVVTRGRDAQTTAGGFARIAGITGDTRYRGFDLSHVLHPGVISLEVSHSLKVDTNQVTSYPFTERTVPYGGAQVASVILNGFNPATDTIRVNLTGLWFSDAEKIAFQKRLGLINDYYAASLILDTLMPGLTSVRMDSAALLPEGFFDAREALKDVALITSKRFEDSLEIAGNDPLQVSPRLRESNRLSRSLLFNFTDLLHATDTIPWGGDQERVTRHAVERIMRYIRFTTRMNNLDGEFFREYLDAYYTEDAFPDEDAVFTELAGKMYPALSPDSASRLLLLNIYQEHLAEAQQLISTSSFADAFLLLTTAKSFAARHPSLSHENGLRELLSLAVTGVYTSYLGIAMAAIDNQKFGMAENYLEKAIEYQGENCFLVTCDTTYKQVFTILFDRRLASCDEMMASGRFEEALECYSTFEESYPAAGTPIPEEQIRNRKERAWFLLYRQEGSLALEYLSNEQYDSAVLLYDRSLGTLANVTDKPSCQGLADTLSAQILPWKFEECYFRGKSYLRDRKYESAWVMFRQASDIQNKLERPADSAFTSDYRTALKHHLLEEISSKSGYIWNDRFDSAYAYLGNLEQSLDGFGLGNDTALMLAMTAYKARIDTKICSNHAQDAEILVVRANRNIGSKRYTVALEQLEEAEKIREELPQCKIVLPGIRDTIMKYTPAAQYQGAMQEISMDYSIGSYSEVVAGMLSMEKFYREHALKQFGLDFDSLESFADRKQDPMLTREAIKFFIAGKKYGTAFRYMRMLRIQVPDPENARDIQAELGLCLASADYSSLEKGTVILRIEGYTEKDPWYRSFGDAYFKEYKRLSASAAKPFSGE